MTTTTGRRQTTVCFTGPRPRDLYGYGPERDADYVRLASDIERLTCMPLYESHGATRFVTGGAQGSDQCAFWAVERMRQMGYPVRNDLFVPFEGQDGRWSAGGLFGRRKYAEMLRTADSVTDCSTPGNGAIPNLLRRNRAMVDASDIVVCVWNKPWQPDIGGERGGTNACVGYALKRGRPVLVHDLVHDERYWLGTK